MFTWAGKGSLEIYMIQGLLLYIFKSSVTVQFSSFQGYLLNAGNFALTVGYVHGDCTAESKQFLKKVLSIR